MSGDGQQCESLWFDVFSCFRGGQACAVQLLIPNNPSGMNSYTLGVKDST